MSPFEVCYGSRLPPVLGHGGVYAGKVAYESAGVILKRCQARSALARVVIGVLAAVGCALTLAVASSDSAAGPLETNRAKARSLGAEIAALDARIDEAVRRYAAAATKLEDARAAIGVNKRKLRVARYELGVARETLTHRAVAIYKHEGVSSLDVVFGAEDFNALVDQFVMFRRVEQSDSNLVDRVARTERELAQRSATLEKDRREAAQLVTQRKRESATIRAQLADRRQILASVQSEIRRLVAEQARVAAAAEAAAQTPADSGGGSDGGDSGGGGDVTSHWWPLIEQAASANGVSARAMYRLMMVESGGSPTVVGAGGFVGLFQYAPKTWKGSWNPWRASSITDGEAQIRATAVALRLGYGPRWWPNTYPWAISGG